MARRGERTAASREEDPVKKNLKAESPPEVPCEPIVKLQEPQPISITEAREQIGQQATEAVLGYVKGMAAIGKRFGEGAPADATMISQITAMRQCFVDLVFMIPPVEKPTTKTEQPESGAAE